MAYWLLKTEPGEYSYADLEREGRARWDGVRGRQALKNIQQLAPGDSALIYHTGKQRAIVGVAQVVTAPYPDPEQSDPKLLVFDLVPSTALPRPVTLAEIKSWPQLSDWLVRQPRLSVVPVPDSAWSAIMQAAGLSTPE
ncbi:MAG: EVE domain-containing protein [Bacillota bacterium]|jgi:predicted RNA-binding protein with PUA-like domain